MPILAEDIKNMPVPQKAELYNLLMNDEELKEYMASNNVLFEELAKRDKDYADGKIRLTTREDLSLRLKQRRDAL